MVTICSGFLDLCVPLNAFDKTQPKQADEPKHAMKSQHDFYWEERCDKSPLPLDAKSTTPELIADELSQSR